MLAELQRLNETWTRAWLQKDAATVERLMAEDYLYVGPNGPVLDRPAILVRHLQSRSQMVADVPAGGMAEVVLGVPAAARGWLPLGRVMLETRFPLGIFRAWSYIEPEARCHRASAQFASSPTSSFERGSRVAAKRA